MALILITGSNRHFGEIIMKALFAVIAGLIAISTGTASISTGTASAHERWFNMVNNSNQAIVAVYASHIDNTSWRFDLLNSIIRPGRTKRMDPGYSQGYCRFDIKIEFENGNSQVINDVNLCEAVEVVTYGNQNHRGRFFYEINY